VFKSLNDENVHLARWESEVADHRIHGTTRQQVREVFERERPALLPLPTGYFPCFREALRAVHRDAHVEVEKAYYSVPPEYVGRTVWVRWDSRLVRVFNGRFDPIAVHVRHEPGRFSTQPGHIASEKISAVERGAGFLLHRAGTVGPATGRWAQTMLEERGIEGVRVLQGLLSLTRKHSGTAIEKACELALRHSQFRLRVVRTLIKHQVRQEQRDFIEEHPLIRDLSYYGRLVKVSFRES